jgi:hypothetical protein
VIRDNNFYSLLEELVYLDEIAGELDPESNQQINQRRTVLKARILEIDPDFK